MRNKINVPEGSQPLFTDMYIESQKVLIEAKGSTNRESIRMAIGQLFDYKRFVDCEKIAVLLPAKPREDLINLLLEYDVLVIYQEDNTFIGY